MSKTSMTAIALGAFGAALLASAAPLNATTIGSAEVSNVDQAGLFCNEYYGRCWRTRGPRYVLRYYYDPSYSPGRGYNQAADGCDRGLRPSRSCLLIDSPRKGVFTRPRPLVDLCKVLLAHYVGGELR
jgi:hypothetical protein